MSFAVMPLEDYKVTCDKVREKTGSEEAIKSGELAGEVEKVFEAGKEDARQWWKTYIERHRTSSGLIGGAQMFRGWDECMFYPPKGTIIRVTGGTSMFHEFGYFTDKVPFDLKARLEECESQIDFSSGAGVTSYMFYRTSITRLPKINISWWSNVLNYTFQLSNLLEYIEELKVSNGCTCKNAFQNCSSLIHVILKVGGTNGKIKGTWDFSYTKLDPESMKSIILCLFDYSGTDEEGVYSILFPEPCWEALEADSVAPDGGTWGNYVLKLGYLK